VRGLVTAIVDNTNGLKGVNGNIKIVLGYKDKKTTVQDSELSISKLLR